MWTSSFHLRRLWRARLRAAAVAVAGPLGLAVAVAAVVAVPTAEHSLQRPAKPFSPVAAAPSQPAPEPQATRQAQLLPRRHAARARLRTLPAPAREASRKAAAAPLRRRRHLAGLHAAAEPAAPPAAAETEPADDEGATGRVQTDAPAPPPEPLEIADLQIDWVSASSARVKWRTNVATSSQAAYGLDRAAAWAVPDAFGFEHAALLTGLSFSTTYTVFVRAVDDWDRAATTTVTLTAAPMAAAPAARTSGSAILVDDQPYFPIAVWGQCSDGVDRSIREGVNLFMGDGCEADHALARRLDGRAYSLVSAADADAGGRGVIGWYYRDEWDAFLASSVTRNDLRTSIVPPTSGRIGFLTVTNHFYSKAAPLPQGKGMYPTLFSIPDVVGFDLYPLQVWCTTALGDVFDAQHELHDLSGGKPTFQWIEAAPMEQPCAKQPSLEPTPATVRAEAWLAVAGGAAGLGYFPHRWSAAIGDAIARVNREIVALAPALLAPTVPARSDSDGVRASARSLNGALYVIAVNTTGSTVQTKLSADGIAGRSLTNLTDGGVVAADGDSFSDTLGPLAARVYVAPPQGW